MSGALTCPYCNAVLPAAPDGSARLTCPRCGETVPNRPAAGGEPARPTPTSPEPHAPVSPASRPRRSPFLVAGVALALVGLAWGAWKLRDRGRSPRTEPQAAAGRVVAPAEMPGLGYLPGSVGAVLAVHMPALIEKLGPDAAGDPVQALRRLGVPDTMIEWAEKASGIGLRHVDQLVIGVGFEKGAFPPQIVFVTQAREPFDMDRIARRFKARSLRKGSRTLHVTGMGPGLEVHWWAPSDRVIVGTFFPREYDEIPERPRAGLDHLRTEVGILIRDAVTRDAAAWVAAASDKWDQHLQPYTTLLPIPPLQGRKDLLAPAKRLRTIALSVPDENGRPVDLRLGLQSAEVAEELRRIYSARFEGEPVEVSGEGDAVRVQTPFEPDQLGRLFGRLIAAGK